MDKDEQSDELTRRKFARSAVFGPLAGWALASERPMGGDLAGRHALASPRLERQGSRPTGTGSVLAPPPPPHSERRSLEGRTSFVDDVLTKAREEGVEEVVLPEEGLPYDAAAVSPPDSIRLSRHQTPDGWYDIMAYGAAKGRSRDSTEAIQAAVDAATSTPPTNGIVWCPNGAYRVTGTIHLPERLVVLGAGEDQTRIVASANNMGPIFQSVDRPDVDFLRIQDIGVYGGYGEVGEGVGVRLHDVHQWTLRNVLIRYCDVGLELERAFTGQAERCTVNQNRTGVLVQDAVNNIVSFTHCNLGFNDVNIQFDEGGAGGKNMKFDTIQLEVTTSEQVAVKGAPFGVTFENCYTEGAALPIELEGAERCTFRGTSFTEGSPVFRLERCRNVRIHDSIQRGDFNRTARNSHFVEAVEDNDAIDVDSVWSPYNTVFISEADLLRRIRMESTPVSCLTDPAETVGFEGVDSTEPDTGWEVRGESSSTAGPGLMGRGLELSLETYDDVVYRFPSAIGQGGRYSIVLIYKVPEDSDVPVEVAATVEDDLRPIKNEEGARVRLSDAVRGEWGVTTIPFEVRDDENVQSISLWHRRSGQRARLLVDSMVVLEGETALMSILPYDVGQWGETEYSAGSSGASL